MIDTFKKRITTGKFFRDASNFQIQRQSDYTSYPEFIEYFSKLSTIKRHNLIIGINFTYGWMPTIFDFRSDHFSEALEILNNAKKGTIPSENELHLLKGLFNNSLVGTSKILHFINPSIFAIWDSRVYRYLTGEAAHSNRIGNCNSYLDFLKFCDFLTKQKGFRALQESLEIKINSSITPYRFAELVMHSHGAKAKRK